MGGFFLELLEKYMAEEQQFEPATTEEAVDFLLNLTEKVELGETDLVVLGNLLEKKGPSQQGRSINNILTESGNRSVSGETWMEAIGCYLETLGLPANFLFENTKEGIKGDETRMAFANRPNLCVTRKRWYDSESSQLISARLEISRNPLGE